MTPKYKIGQIVFTTLSTPHTPVAPLVIERIDISRDGVKYHCRSSQSRNRIGADITGTYVCAEDNIFPRHKDALNAFIRVARRAASLDFADFYNGLEILISSKLPENKRFFEAQNLLV